jgi:mannan endo-1,4-beta-mannosidase
MEAAAGAPHLVGSNLPPGVTGPELIRQLLDAAVQHGMTVVRAW